MTFPYVNLGKSRQCYKEILSWKKSGIKFENEDKVLSCVGFGKGSSEREMISNYIKNVDGEMTAEEVLDLLEEKLNPDKIADDRLYSLPQVVEITKMKISTPSLKKIVERDKNVKLEKYGSHCCIRGEYIPYVRELVERERQSRRARQYEYPPVEDGVNYVPLVEAMREMNIFPSRLDTVFRKMPELRRMIRRGEGRRRMLIKEREEEFKKAVKSILQQA